MNPEPRRRFSLTVHYDGAPFHGWQLQDGVRTVQGEVEGVLERITGARRPVVASGRTDAGVHAEGQVASVDLTDRWETRELRAAMNALLPQEIWVEEARRVPDDFHPRYHAIARSYRYQLGTHPWAGSPFRRRWCWDVSDDPPELVLLVRAAELISGDRSFRKLSKAGQPQRGERCRVNAADWVEAGEGEYHFRITADRYLHHMVRYLVGTMVAVARGTRSLQEFEELLGDPNSHLTTSPPAPPEGLFLARVEYPPERLGDHPDRDPPARTNERSGSQTSDLNDETA